MIELLFLLSITQISDPIIECPAGCYPHTNLDLWKVRFEVENFDMANKGFEHCFRDNCYYFPVYSTSKGLVTFQFDFRWLE